MYSCRDTTNESLLLLVTSAIRERRVQLVTQGIHSLEESGSLLYEECLARLLDQDGNICSIGKFARVLEAAGQANLLDRVILEMVLDDLKSDSSAVLGCNISGDSLTNDVDWSWLLAKVKSNACLANRLIIELTETRPIGDPTRANQRLAELRQLGCRIAIDDFGAGIMSPAVLLQLNVDIVKIDATFVNNIRCNSDGDSSLRHMIGFAACITPLIIVEGIEKADQMAEAINAGASHAQGFFLSLPKERIAS